MHEENLPWYGYNSNNKILSQLLSTQMAFLFFKYTDPCLNFYRGNFLLRHSLRVKLRTTGNGHAHRMRASVSLKVKVILLLVTFLTFIPTMFTILELICLLIFVT